MAERPDAPVLLIRSERLVLRPWQLGDEEALVRHANNPRIWRNLRDRFPHPYTDADAAAWLRSVGAESEGPMNLAIVVDGEPVGGVGLERQPDVYRRTAEIGYWLGEAVWGRGLATEAVRRLSEHAFAELAFARLQACVFAWNPASCRVLEKAGYRLEARLASSVFKDGQLIDSFLYARLRESPGNGTS